MKSLSFPAAILSLGFLASVFVPGCSCNSSQKSGEPTASGATVKPPDGAPAGAASAATPAPGSPKAEAAPLSPECAALLAQIKGLEAKIPIRFAYLPRPVEEIYKDIVACTDLSRRFLAECPGETASCQVQRLLARLLLTGSRFYQQELTAAKVPPEEITAKMEARIAEIRALADGAIATCPGGTTERLKALRVVIDLATQFGPPTKLREAAATLLKEFPQFDDQADIHLAVARSLMAERDYKGAVDYLDRVIQLHEKDPEFVLYNDVLFNALRGVGDLDRIEELLHIMSADYPERLPEITGEAHVLAEQWLDTYTFWLGFVTYSMGNVADAEGWFLKSEEHLEQKIKDLRAAGKPVNPVIDIYLKFRTKDYIQYLRDFHGKVPDVDFDLGSLWATKATLKLGESRGKVVAVVFREPGNDRAASFLQEIDALVKERGKDGLAGVVLNYVIGPNQPGQEEKMLAEMSADLEQLGVTLPAGYDPDRANQKISRKLHATVGPTATCIVFNRRGEPVWYTSDPTDLDRNVARKVIERLLKEAP